MHKRLCYTLILIVLLLSACTTVRGSGKVVTETRDVSGFNEVSLSGQGEIILTQGDRESLEIEAEENIIPRITTEVKNGRLNIDYKRGNILATKPIRFHLTITDLSGLELSGSGKFDAARIESDRFQLKSSGSGEINIDSLTARTLNVELNGSAECDLAGEVETQQIEVNGSGEYRAGMLASQAATLEVNGSSEATVWANDRLEIEINGSGRVDYYGNPSLSQDISRSGKVTGLGDP